MRDMLATALPNLHPALVHFPVALLSVALAFDAASLLVRTRTWLDRTAAALYFVGALGALAAFLSGRRAADGLGMVPSDVEKLLGEHSDWALRTLLFFGALALARLAVSWRDRRASVIGQRPIRGLLVGISVLGQWLLFQTADRGGSLVYQHAVAVTIPPPPAADEDLESRSVDPPESRLRRRDDGTLTWVPASHDTAAIGSVLEPLGDVETSGVRATLSDDQDSGLEFQVAGRALLVFRDTFADVRVEAAVVLAGFTGTVGLLHNVQGPEALRSFEVSVDGTVQLVRYQNGKPETLDHTIVDLPTGTIELSVSASGTHFKGYVNTVTAVHGHGSADTPGRTGLLLDGHGTVRILQMKVTTLER